MNVIDWSNDPRIPFQPPDLSLNEQAEIQKVIPHPVKMTPLVFRLLKEVGLQCEHERLVWYGAPVGPFERDLDLHQELANIGPVMVEWVMTLVTIVDAVIHVWTKLMTLPSSKCAQIEHLLIDQQDFWIAVQNILEVERRAWN